MLHFKVEWAMFNPDTLKFSVESAGFTVISMIDHSASPAFGIGVLAQKPNNGRVSNEIKEYLPNIIPRSGSSYLNNLIRLNYAFFIDRPYHFHSIILVYKALFLIPMVVMRRLIMFIKKIG